MTWIERLKEFKYQIADKLFCSEMDDAYRMGIREGATFATKKIQMELSLKQAGLNMTKTEQKGFAKAIELVGDSRKEIKSQTGAQFL